MQKPKDEGQWRREETPNRDAMAPDRRVNRKPRDRFLALFGEVFPRSEWTEAKLDALLGSIDYRRLEPGESILREGQSCTKVPFVIEGAIRVYKSAESGREISLYSIEEGQVCILSAGCGSGLPSFPASVIAERASLAAFMPRSLVLRLLDESPAFRAFLLDQYSRRMAEIFELVEEVAFRKVDERLRQWLAERAGDGGGRIAATHQELADRIGTSREVVSRILKDWEERGAVSLSRGAVELLDGFGALASP